MQVGLPGTDQTLAQGQATNGRVAQAIRTGSAATGVSFDYLARTAYRESSYRTDLTMSTSSATGLYQFLDQTWLGLMKTEGPGVGLGAAAEAITRDRNGRYDVADPAAKQRILDLRKDPTVSAVMAGKFTQQNQAYMTGQLGRAPTSGELYAGHVLGPAGGTKIIQLMGKDPGGAAADYFPEAAASNKAIFYQQNGAPKSVSDVYGWLTREADVPSPNNVASTPVVGTIAVAPRPSPAPVTSLSTIIAAQQAGNTRQEPLAFSVTGGADEARRSIDTTIGQLSIPGDVGKKPTEAGSTMSGWRAKRSNDAFSALMRSDANDLAAQPPLDLMALSQGGTAASAAASRLLPGLSGIAGTGANGFAPLAAHMTTSSAGATEAMAQGTAGATGIAGDGQRHSRVYTEALRKAGGAPLPMVTGSLGVMRPSRFSASSYVDANPTAPVSSGSAGRGGLPLGALGFAATADVAAPITSIVAPTAPAAATTVTGGMPILPPVPGEVPDGPLDLVAASRGRVL
jgi:hypothetical protein